MRVFGTAGHVDHGKSTLVEALTGIDPDRLQEEKDRQMTIDLGFAWMTLPDGEPIGIVDVPGHRDFIENMLAGVGGIDAVLFVIAADEGVMPQTREHLAILDLLEVSQGVVVLTKIDLVEDASWIELVREEITALLESSSIKGAPLVEVSARTGQGIDRLVEAISQAVDETAPSEDIGKPRLPIDRAFTISGFGTVVTGTLTDGSFEVGQEVEVLPQGMRGRVRGLQTHQHKIEQAVTGSRVAANLSGIDTKEVRRGDVVTLPGTYEPTRFLDVHFKHLHESPRPLRHNQYVKLFLGAAQRVVRVRVLGVEKIAPGEEGWIQLVCETPVVAVHGDRFIVRQPSPSATLGGGRVVDPHPSRRHKRRDQTVLDRLSRLYEGKPEQRLLQTIRSLGPGPLDKIVLHSGLQLEIAKEAIRDLKASDAIVGLEDGDLTPKSSLFVVDQETWGEIVGQLTSILAKYHSENPLRMGIPREELKSRTRFEARSFNAILNYALSQGVLVAQNAVFHSPAHQITLTQTQQSKVDKLLQAFRQSPYSPPSVKESLAVVGDDLFGYLLEIGQLHRLSPEVVLDAKSYEEMVMGVKEELEARGTLTVAQVRDRFETSRKYALALMEHLDEIGVTVREGDERRLV